MIIDKTLNIDSDFLREDIEKKGGLERFAKKCNMTVDILNMYLNKEVICNKEAWKIIKLTLNKKYKNEKRK